MATVKLVNIKKIYDGKTEAVHNVNLEIQDNEFVVLVGPTGCGKSTTLRMIAGLETISSGELYIDDKLMNYVEPKDRDIAMVFQNYALYPHMSVHDNIAFALESLHLKKAAVEEKINTAAKILDIEDLLDRKPKQLSGGQRQRVAIGRAIVRNPKVMLMDEPLSNLDAKLRNQMRAEILKLRKQIKTTFVYVTHDQTEAMTLGDRIVVMRDGWILQVGTPEEVFNNPANVFVASFIGSPQMNFFKGELEEDNGNYSVLVHGIRVNLGKEKQDRLRKNNIHSQSITVGIRPDHLVVDDAGFPAIIQVSEMMGTSIHLHATIDNNEIIVIVPSIGSKNKYESDKVINLSFSGEAVHVFDPVSERNLEYISDESDISSSDAE